MIAKRLWFEGERIYIETDDDRTLWQSVLYYQRLRTATELQRNTYELGAFGIHWEELDEDVSYESFEYDNLEPSGISRFFLTHPEINASAVARRMGIKQSLLAQYIRGLKKPSVEREQMILQTIHEIGKELSRATF
jgi:transcriptional regulator with XRE-family HTH domain